MVFIKKGTITETVSISNKYTVNVQFTFEGIMHSHGHNSGETQMRTTVFVMRHNICEQLRKMNLCSLYMYSDGTIIL